MRTLEGCHPLISIERFSQSMPMAGAATPPGCVPFSPHAYRGWSDLAPPSANGLQAFGLNEASSLAVREE